MKRLKILLLISVLGIFTLGGSLASAQTPKAFVKMQTSMGNIVIELNKEKAPESTANFLRYVNEGHYDGTIFHRVIDGFMIQGGNMDKEMKRRDTHGAIKNEARNGLYNDKYTLAMARTADPHSATDQFFINVVDNKFLNFKSATPSGWGYAVFGKVIGGKKIVDKIAKSVTFRKANFTDVPVKPITIIKAEEVKQ